MALRISVVTAVKNCGKTIRDTLHSVAAQSYPRIEHVVVDGQSSDDTFEIAKTAAVDGATLISEKDNGVYSAFNRGIRAATGDVIGFLNGDDVYADQEVITRVATVLEREEVDGLYGDLVYVDRADTARVVRHWSAGRHDIRAVWRGWMPPHPTVFLRRGVFERYGLFDESFRISGDYEFLLRVLLSGQVTLAYLPGVLVRMRTGGMSNWPPSNLYRKWVEDLRAMRAHGLPARRTLLRKNIRKLPQLVRSAVERRTVSARLSVRAR